MTDKLIAEGWAIRKTTGFAAHVGPLWMRHADGVAEYGVLVSEIHLNRRGHLHGGMLSTLADNTLALTVADAVPNRPIATIQLNIHFTAPARLGDFVEANCELVKATRSLVFVRGEFTVGRTAIGAADGIWKILDEVSNQGGADAAADGA